MSGSLKALVRIAGSQSVQERLIGALRATDVEWQGDGTVEDLTEKLQERLLQGFTSWGEVRHLKPRQQKDEDEPSRWFDPYMPPVHRCYWASRMGWSILVGETGQTFDSSLVRNVVTKGAERLIKVWDMRTSQRLVCEPARYSVLSPLPRSRGWLAIQLFTHLNQKRVNYCQCCQRCDWESLGTLDCCIAVVTGVDTGVVQTEWLIYRGTRW